MDTRVKPAYDGLDPAIAVPNRLMKKIGFLSFGNCAPSPHSET